MTGKFTGRRRWIDRITLRLSQHFQHDGLTIAVLEVQHAAADVVRRVTDALILLENHDPRGYRRLKKDCERVWVKVLVGTISEYRHGVRTILVDERFLMSHPTSDIAAVFLHEAMHARLCAQGVVYGDEGRRKVEQACFRRELEFASKFPESAPFIATVQRIQEMPDSEWTYKHLHTQRMNAATRALSYLGTPSLVARLVVWSMKFWQRFRRGRAA
jgi:hypothetical protein